jgi:hypothetical protein
MRQILLQPDFDAWRESAREALRLGYGPEELDFIDATAPAALALDDDAEPTGVLHGRPKISRAFLSTAMLAGAHRDPGRWNLLYRVLYRVQLEHGLLTRDADRDVTAMQHLAAQVRRDLRRMRAELRFHKVLAPDSPEPHPMVLDEPVVQIDPGEPDPHRLVLATPTPFGVTRTEIEPCVVPPEMECDHYIAWHRPEHRILTLAAPWYSRRYAILPWTILTPDASATWNPRNGHLTYTPGVKRDSAPTEAELDQLEPVWRTHYALHSMQPTGLREA